MKKSEIYSKESNNHYKFRFYTTARLAYLILHPDTEKSYFIDTTNSTQTSFL